MNKIWLVIRREYSTRVKNKTFLLTTFLLPIVMILFIAGAVYLSVKGRDENKIAVIDSNGFFKEALKNTSTLQFNFNSGADTSNYTAKGYNGLLTIPTWNGKDALNYQLQSPKQLGVNATEAIRQKINDVITDKMLQQQGITSKLLDSIRQASPQATLQEISGNGGNFKATDSKLASGIGFASGFLIYLLMFIYGAAVMRGVMEEKTSRIAEVIVSSVKPFQLMLGKIIGIGGVGLTQFVLWIILLIGIGFVAQAFIPAHVMEEVKNLQQSAAIPGGITAIGQTSELSQKVFELKQSVSTAPWGLIISCFVFYFISGYLFYAALFASVGCMVNEDPQDAQALMLPIMMPIIFSFIIMQSAIQNPNSSLAFWGSIIPFTSPIVMIARIPTEPPVWQILLSMVLMIVGFLFTTWMAGKIYRTGILMYGKKGNWKQMMKWVFTKS